MSIRIKWSKGTSWTYGSGARRKEPNNGAVQQAYGSGSADRPGECRYGSNGRRALRGHTEVERGGRSRIMEPFSKHTGVVAPIDRVNVDTDQMVPKQFLKLLTREGFGRVLFYDWRYLPGEKLNPEFVL